MGTPRNPKRYANLSAMLFILLLYLKANLSIGGLALGYTPIRIFCRFHFLEVYLYY